MCQLGKWFEKMSWLWANQMAQHMMKGMFLALIGLTSAHQECHASWTDMPYHRVGIWVAERIDCYRSIETRQWRKRWFVDSVLFLHKQHHDGSWKVCFMRLSPVGALFLSTIHMNKHDLGGAFNFQSWLHHYSKTGGWWSAKMLRYPSLGEYNPWFSNAQISSSSPYMILIWDSVSDIKYDSQFWCHIWGRFSRWVVFHACWKRVVLSRSAMWSKCEIPMLLSSVIKSCGSLCKLPHPIQGSKPMRTKVSEWIFQVIPPNEWRGVENYST